LGIRLGWGAATVTVTQAAPLESVSPAGDITGVKEAAAGSTYKLVSVANGQVTMQDASGLYRIAITATDYVPPAVTSPAAPATNAPSATPAAVPAPKPPAAAAPSANSSSSSSASVAPPAPAGSAGSGTTLSQDLVDWYNNGLGKPIFSAQSIWSESALAIAQRLGLGLEGRTKWETSYRHYFSGDPTDKKAALLGTACYCIALYADADDHPTSLLIAFANDGDYKYIALAQHDLAVIDHPTEGEKRNFPDKTRDQLQKEIDDDKASFEPTRTAEAETLTDNLDTLFGDAKRATFGDDPATREEIKRWDFNDVSLLLTSTENKYNLLRIVPTALADNNGRTERIGRDVIGDKLAGAVEHRPNGDVIITQIPMADQGPKGYCVPATWERVLRYEGVPGDMYTLSRIGSSGFGGGTWGPNIAQQLDDTLHNYGRHFESLTLDTLDVLAIHRYIDQGIPIFWSINPTGYDAVDQRYALADRDKEWDRWKSLLPAADAAAAKAPQADREFGHQVLIIGYNSETKELAWTDPWGRQTTERWMLVSEAQKMTLGEYYTISW